MFNNSTCKSRKKKNRLTIASCTILVVSNH